MLLDVPAWQVKACAARDFDKKALHTQLVEMHTDHDQLAQVLGMDHVY